ncbi:S8 family peptidase [Thermoflavimicrobium dichotomicum]|uniref:Major intracellular serine protease n=1 Tax=Thermoflavimicrobium dichotomicum TaxID=46223 RepID=A0A1I3UXQ6_9BACL|nr:S8 family peptidase [Thermoflavimicrobium dichotomicum]SFJ88164.1 major intracellular serine protease [Thermoflavimicrobium dichotomicum]
MTQVKLIPYKVEEVMKERSEIPKGVKMIKAPEFWQASNKGEDVVVAVLDTGCQIDHPDLKDRIIDKRNFSTDYNGDPDQVDDGAGHGTHVAGTIAAIENDLGVVGVAPQVKLLIVKVLSNDGSGTYESVINGIDYATNWKGSNGQRVRVINMSLGGPNDDPELHAAIKRAVEQGIVVVCAAGNEGDGKAETEEKSYPGAYPEVVQVGAVDFQGKFTEFTNTNSQVDLVAPGHQIVSTYPKSQYATLSGTSMATPHVSGAIALIINQAEKAFRRSLTEAEVYAQLCKHTVSLGHDKWAEGNGLVDLSMGLKPQIRNLEEEDL